MNIEVPVQMTVSEGFGPIPSSQSIVIDEFTVSKNDDGNYVFRTELTGSEIKEHLDNGAVVIAKIGDFCLSPIVQLSEYALSSQGVFVMDFGPDGFPDRRLANYHFIIAIDNSHAVNASQSSYTVPMVMVAKASVIDSVLTLDKKFYELRSVVNVGGILFVKYVDSTLGADSIWPVVTVERSNSARKVVALTSSGVITFTAETDNDYPKVG